MNSAVVELDHFRWPPEKYDALAGDPDNLGYLFCNEIADIWLAVFFEALSSEHCWPHLMTCVDGPNAPLDAVYDHLKLLRHVLDHFRQRLAGTTLLSWMTKNVPDNQGAQQLLARIGQTALYNLGDYGGPNRFEGFRKLAERCITRKQLVYLEVVTPQLYEAVALPYPEYFVSAASLFHYIDDVTPTLKAKHPDLFLFDGRLTSKRIGLCQMAMDWLVPRFFARNIVLLRSYGEQFHDGIHFQVRDYTFSIINVSSPKTDVLVLLCQISFQPSPIVM